MTAVSWLWRWFRPFALCAAALALGAALWTAAATVFAVVLRFANIVGDIVAAVAVEVVSALAGRPLVRTCAMCDDVAEG